MQLSCVYEITLPSGQRLVTGNLDLARNDVDFVGYLEPEQGIAGLDSPDLREVSQEIVQGDGGLHLDFFHGRRPIVINGSLNPNATSIAVLMALEQKVKRLGTCTRADAIMRWTNDGFPKRRLRLRSQPGLRIVGRRPKTFQVPMVDADWRIQSDAVNSLGPWGVNAGVLSIANTGDVVATPRLELTGPFTGASGAPITLENTTLGLAMKFKGTFSVPAGQALVVDLKPPYPVVTLNGANAYGQIDFLNTAWWGLVPGSQNVQVTASAGTGTWKVLWRDAWI